jgi:hypothetical protein
MEKEKNTVTRSRGIWRKVLVLAGAGGLAFWAANFLVSLTPIAAEYRAALSIPYRPMLLAALLGGLMIGFCVSWFLLRFSDRIPARNPILKSILLSFIVLIIVTVLIEGPASLFAGPSDALRCFLIGLVFNALRILALGTVVGCLSDRVTGGARS